MRGAKTGGAKPAPVEPLHGGAGLAAAFANLKNGGKASVKKEDVSFASSDPMLKQQQRDVAFLLR